MQRRPTVGPGSQWTPFRECLPGVIFPNWVRVRQCKGGKHGEWRGGHGTGMFRGAVVRGKGRGWGDDGTAHVPPPHEGTLPMGNNPCRLAADMVKSLVTVASASTLQTGLLQRCVITLKARFVFLETDTKTNTETETETETYTETQTETKTERERERDREIDR